MKIAVLNNEATLLKTLNTAGHNAIVFNNAKELQHEQFDMLIVDNDNAIKIIASVREKCKAILFITNVFSEENILAALNAGATDYLIKPVRRTELLTRVEVMLRRAYPDKFVSEKLQFGRYVFETRSARVSLSSHCIELTRKEFDLALLLFRNLGKPLSRATMLEAVWSSDSDIPSRTLDTHISRVRNKLQLRPENGFRLVPVYSFGYCLEQIGE
jgi:DNA-binding response OmpR family regulator